MATKSVGTLAAKLTVDTQGWFAGFGKADKKQQQFASQAATRFSKLGVISGRLGGALAALGPAGVVAGTALGAVYTASRLAQRGVHEVAQAMQDIDKEFSTKASLAKRAEEAAETVKDLGLSLTRLDVGKVLKANDAMAKLAAIGDGIARKFAVELAPALIAGVDHIIKKAEELGRQLKSAGITWDFVGDVLVATGAVAVSVFDAMAAKVEQAIALAKVLGAQWQANAAILRGDFAGAIQATVRGAGAAGEAMAAEGKFYSALTGRSAMGFINKASELRAGSRIGGEIGGLGSPKNQSPLERGTKEAAIAVAAMGGNPIKSVENNTANMLTVLERIDGRLAQPERARNAAEAHQMRMARL